jgi:hypothetical protein
MVTKALRTFIRIYPILGSERLNVTSELTRFKVLIKSRMTYACTTWEFQMRRLQNRDLHTIGNLPRCTSTNALHLAFKIPYLYDSSSFLGSTAQRRPWPPPQNPAEFLGGFSTIFFFTE